MAVERVVELVVATRNRRRLLAAGGREVGAGHYPVMVALHSGLLVAAPLEVWWLGRSFEPRVGGIAILVVAATMGLRYWVVATLGGRWTTRVVVVPDAPLVVSGPFRWVRHPNYLGVALEVPAIPLVHGAWLTAVLFGLANLGLLRHRIRVEDRALGTR